MEERLPVVFVICLSCLFVCSKGESSVQSPRMFELQRKNEVNPTNVTTTAGETYDDEHQEALQLFRILQNILQRDDGHFAFDQSSNDLNGRRINLEQDIPPKKNHYSVYLAEENRISSTRKNNKRQDEPSRALVPPDRIQNFPYFFESKPIPVKVAQLNIQKSIPIYESEDYS